MLKRNLAANFLGQFVGIAVGIAFVPLYIRYLGVEAYGVVGFYAMLQSWLMLLDVGLSPTLMREMARLRGGAHSPESAWDLLRSLELVAAVIAVVAALLVFALAPVIASRWLQPESLRPDEITHALRIMAAVSGLRFVESLHRSVLLGLERQVLANVVSGTASLVRAIGAVVVLAWFSPSLEAFFVWQLVVSIATAFAIAICAYMALPSAGRRARPSVQALVHVRSYATQMSIGAVLGFLLTQVDKLLLSRMIPLEAYGEYVLAGTASGAVFTLVGPISQAYFPRLCQFHAAGKAAEFARTFHLGSQVVSVVVGTAGILVAMRSEELVFAWTGNHELALRLWPVVSVLAVANTLNGVIWMLYQAQLAHGWVRFGLVFNGIAVCVVVPAMLLIVPELGGIGAAYVWLFLNMIFLTAAPPLVFRRILRGEQVAWYVRDLFVPLGVSACTAALLAGLFPLGSSDRWFVAARCVGEGAFALALSTLACPMLRNYLVSLGQRRWILRRSRSLGSHTAPKS